jgi:nucleotide-binding universal stress UspA family protein
MSYKDILVYLDPTADSEVRLGLAASMAAAHGARLIGMDVSSDAAFDSDFRDRALGLPDLFEEALRRMGVEGVYFSATPWKKRGDHHYAHYVDLIIASHLESFAQDLVISGIPEEVLVTAGVPVLLLPSGWKQHAVGENIVIAWKSGREAIRAVHDSMPILMRAKKVTAFTFAPHAELFGNEQDSLVNHLLRHGVVAGSSGWPSVGDISAVEALFACLESQEADLIVAGAYGHSRLLEGLFGGASRDLMRQPSLPVLMSH